MRELSRTRVGTNAVQREGWEDGEYWCETTFHDEKSLENNQKIKHSGMLKNHTLGLHDNEDTRAVVSCPSTMQWNIFKSKHRETYKLILSKIEAERMKGVRQLQLLEPDWVLMTRY